MFRFAALLLVFLPLSAKADFATQLAEAAEERATHFVLYDPSYRSMDYPMGDVAANRGVCTDVVIRAYRALDIDLQQEVHEDMRAAFTRYPKIWGLSRPDPNIDHRRVPNLETFFKRHGQSLPVSDRPEDYLPGDVVSWRLPGGWPHIGIVTTRKTDAGMPLISHNIGLGTRVEDMLFDFDIVGHFRFDGGN
ncbi:DUF1287 domain-containing protein [Halovulum sp. GXIMD14793]